MLLQWILLFTSSGVKYIDSAEWQLTGCRRNGRRWGVKKWDRWLDTNQNLQEEKIGLEDACKLKRCEKKEGKGKKDTENEPGAVCLIYCGVARLCC